MAAHITKKRLVTCPICGEQFTTVRAKYCLQCQNTASKLGYKTEDIDEEYIKRHKRG